MDDVQYLSETINAEDSALFTGIVLLSSALFSTVFLAEAFISHINRPEAMSSAMTLASCAAGSALTGSLLAIGIYATAKAAMKAAAKE